MTSASDIDAGTAISQRPQTLSVFDLALYGVTVLAWGFSWYALKLQAVITPEIALFWRFLFATVLMWGWAILRGHKMNFPLRAHMSFAALGLLLFSTNFLLFYHGSREIPSGLLSVVFSLASVFNIVLGFVLFGQGESGACSGRRSWLFRHLPDVLSGNLGQHVESGSIGRTWSLYSGHAKLLFWQHYLRQSKRAEDLCHFRQCVGHGVWHAAAWREWSGARGKLSDSIYAGVHLELALHGCHRVHRGVWCLSDLAGPYRVSARRLCNSDVPGCGAWRFHGDGRVHMDCDLHPWPDVCAGWQLDRA